MARKAEIILTDDGKIVVLGSVTKGGLNLFELTERRFDVPTLQDAQDMAGDFLLGAPVRVKTR